MAPKKRTLIKAPAKRKKSSTPASLKRVLIILGRPVFALIVYVLFFLERAWVLFNKFLNLRIKFPKTKYFRRTKIPKDIHFLKKSLLLAKLKINLLALWLVIKIKLFVKSPFRIYRFSFKKRFIVLIPILFCVFLIFYFYIVIIYNLPSPKELTRRNLQVSTKIYDRNGKVLYKIYNEQNRTPVPLNEIPLHVRLATLAAEDAEFYNHPGFSLKGILRAAVQDIKTGSLQGGSTITQQLVKNTLLTPEKTITRKIKEVILSVEVEAIYTKDEILEMYLNQVSFGGTAYGIEEASREFFGKDVGKLNLSEASYLAGLPRSPTTYSPYGPTPEKGLERQKEVLRLMKINKYITREQELDSSKYELVFLPHKDEIYAPHFVMYIKKLLVDKYGEEMVEKGGLEVVTSLDLSIQQMAEKVVADEVKSLKRLNVGNGAALVTNPKTGEVLAMVGSTNYFDSSNDGQVNVLLQLRQPGSSIKVVNYAYALSKGGLTAGSIINDSPISYHTPGSKPYSPVNYDGKFKGNISLRSALAQSRNIPAVKVLAGYGVSKMVEQGKSMGITSWEQPNMFGLSLTLGGGAVYGLDMAKVYSVLANSGNRAELMPILSVKNYKGRVLENNKPKLTPVLDPKVAFILTNILSDNFARSPEFGLNSYLNVKNHPEVAVKTGTSNDLRDNWTIGYNQNYLVLTWVGNNNNSPMSRVASGITGASPIWNKIISELLKDTNPIAWNIPNDVIKVDCPVAHEYFIKGTVPKSFCKPAPTQAPLNAEDKILNGVSTANLR